MDDVFIGFGMALGVIHVPAERFEERIEKFLAKLGLVIAAGFVGIEILFELGDEAVNFFGRGQGFIFSTQVIIAR